MNSCGTQEPMLKPAKMKLLNFLAKTHGTNLRCFPSQYDVALRDEERVKTTVVARAAKASESSSFSNSE